jgi:hypothetical protein
VGRGDALLDFDDLALELITGTEFDGASQFWPGAKPWLIRIFCPSGDMM